jgi:hypothetical protein
VAVPFDDGGAEVVAVDDGGVDAGPVEVLEGFERPAEVGALGGQVGGDVGQLEGDDL